MAPIAFGSSADRHTPSNALKKLDHEKLDGFGTRAVHIGSDPDPSTGAVIPAISLSTTYKQNGVGNHKVSESDGYAEISSGQELNFFYGRVRDLNTRDQGIPIEAHLNKRYHRSNPTVPTLSPLHRVLPRPPRSCSLSGTTHTSSALTMFMVALSVT